MSAEGLIQVKDLDLTYIKEGKPFPVIKGLNLSVGRGEFVVLVGPSDSGKTCLLRLIAGFENPTGGEILVNGQPVTGPDPSRGYVFQDMILFPWMTVYENASFGPKSRGLDEKQVKEVTSKWLDKIGLTRFQKKYLHELSGGMQQRVGFARVMANNPDVLLCDEPLGQLDWVSRETLSNEILEVWHETGKTVVYVTQAIEEAVYVAQKIHVFTPRPSKVAQTLRIELPGKRWEDKELRFKKEYYYYVEQLREIITKQGSKPVEKGPCEAA
jgi:ABC-type nitrate/sulfonate/bicarbonate transport system ATPase subunit